MSWTAQSLRSGHYVEHITSTVASRPFCCSNTAISLGKTPVPLRLGMAERVSLSHSGPLHLLHLAVVLHDKFVSSTPGNNSLSASGKETSSPTALAMYTSCNSKAHRRASSNWRNYDEKPVLQTHQSFWEQMWKTPPNLQGNGSCNSWWSHLHVGYSVQLKRE